MAEENNRKKRLETSNEFRVARREFLVRTGLSAGALLLTGGPPPALVLDESTPGTLSGTGDFGGGDTMRYQGSIAHGDWITVRFQGVGTGPKNKDWLYDYVGVIVPQWPNGVGQVQAIVGSVVRSAPHSNGSGATSPAGRVASFIAVKK